MAMNNKKKNSFGWNPDTKFNHMIIKKLFETKWICPASLGDTMWFIRGFWFRRDKYGNGGMKTHLWERNLFCVNVV